MARSEDVDWLIRNDFGDPNQKVSSIGGGVYVLNGMAQAQVLKGKLPDFNSPKYYENMGDLGQIKHR